MALLNLEELKKIDSRTRFTVFGFVRDAQKSLLSISKKDPYYIIPELVIYLILNFYYIRTFWDKIAAGFTVSEDKQTVINDNGYGWNNASYINIEVDSMEECIAKWYITTKQPYEGDSQLHVKIGIVGGTFSTEGMDTYFNPSEDKVDYAYWSYGGRIVSSNSLSARDTINWHGSGFDSNDLICCVLDLKRKQISFELNGKKQGTASRNIRFQQGFKYRCGISAFYGQTECTIVRFEKVNN